MSNCCCNGEPEAQNGAQEICPECGVAGKPVETVTLKHMVQPQFLDDVNGGGFRFCRSAECDVVYFHPDGRQLGKADLRVRVGLKETGDAAPICYCFGFTEGMAREEIESTGKCSIPDRISAEMKHELCACEVRNPQGSCCLGNVKAVVKRLLHSRSNAIAPITQ